MQMSNRISGFQASPIRRLVPYSRDAEEKGVHVIHLNIGQPDIKTPVEAIDAIHNYDKDIIEYGISEGEVVLRRGLVRYYAKYGIPVSQDDIMITTGGSEAIQFVFMTLCDPFDEFIIPEPYYTNVATFANIAMVTLRPVTSSSDDNFALPSIPEFEKRINKKTMGIMLCSPNNPTGHVYTHEELRGLLELCKKYDIFLVVDEVYREFCYDGKSFTSVLSFPEYQDRVICIDSFSKRFSMCGSRIGAIVSRNREVIESALKLAQARLCPPAVEQVAAAAALTAPDDYVEKVRAEYERRRNVMISRMQRIPGVRCSLPKGAFYFVVDLPVDDAEKFAIFMLRDFTYEGCTAMFAPAEGFYVTPGLGKNQARIAYVLNEKELLMAAECIERGLKVYREKVMKVND
ncbi:MAG: pyridoxal phosphate-dependent aminotransferase [Spirochaetes bacterium]|uniref:Aminotransferase n=1 Tax=Candidatus Ornithospirochaeta stercoripullorum TaxID=2840899 RepID=A0A9D9E0G9_9SPIO|nr:pyridoxal phosphate-dependent aminotransferase [Candidatus Ornithospirochaeta stercoripullorum]